ncbi:hypothetical protein CW304_29845 [Bacillus sp. UFRGS-B20]|nr:hypothetical protein CW304_29845 [Bacillus sp. UFRGS-B20]
MQRDSQIASHVFCLVLTSFKLLATCGECFTYTALLHVELLLLSLDDSNRSFPFADVVVSV